MKLPVESPGNECQVHHQLTLSVASFPSKCSELTCALSATHHLILCIFASCEDRAEWGLSRHDGYLVQGSDIEVANMSIKAAKGYAMTLPKCTGFSYKSGSDPTTIWFKHTLTSVYGGKSSGFVTYLVGSRLSKHHGYLVQGSDIEVKQMTIRQAKKYALELPKCTGCCFKPTGKQFDDDEETTVWFKHTITEVCAPQSGWITYLVE